MSVTVPQMDAECRLPPICSSMASISQHCGLLSEPASESSKNTGLWAPPQSLWFSRSGPGAKNMRVNKFSRATNDAAGARIQLWEPLPPKVRLICLHFLPLFPAFGSILLSKVFTPNFSNLGSKYCLRADPKKQLKAKWKWSLFSFKELAGLFLNHPAVTFFMKETEKQGWHCC